jgi:adenosylmethionine-8-amino-7-oxononanoate aminotransferase
MRTNLTFDTEKLHEQDRHWVHPWEDLKALPNAARTIVAQSEGIYLHDSDGNKLIDGPAGMWCVNIGHGREEMAQAISEQVMRMPYYSPWSLGNVPAAQLAEKLAELAPGDLNHVFFTTGGSTSVDSALRFMMYFNNALGRPEKKHIISRADAYHGSTYLGASCSGKVRDKNLMDFETAKVHLLPSVPAPSLPSRSWRPVASSSRRPAITGARWKSAGNTMYSIFPTRWLPDSGGWATGSRPRMFSTSFPTSSCRPRG